MDVLLGERDLGAVDVLKLADLFLSLDCLQIWPNDIFYTADAGKFDDLPSRAAFGEAFANDSVQRFVDFQGGGIAFDDRGDNAGGGAAVEGFFTADDFVEDAAEGEDVATGVRRFALELLGRHVLESAEDLAIASEAFC